MHVFIYVLFIYVPSYCFMHHWHDTRLVQIHMRLYLLTHLMCTHSLAHCACTHAHASVPPSIFH